MPARRWPMSVGADGNRRGDVPRMEEEVRQPGRVRVAADASAARRDARLKRVVADLTLDKHILNEVIRKKL